MERTAVATTAFFLVSPAYYRHYAAFAMPALAILVGGALIAGLSWLRMQGRQAVTIAATGAVAIAVVLDPRAGRPPAIRGRGTRR